MMMMNSIKSKARSTKRSNSTIQEHIADAKPCKNFRIRSSKKLCRHNIPELPFDIIVNIISRLPVKPIIRCKLLSKAFKNLISDPSFSHIYQNNEPNFSCSLSTSYRRPDYCFHLMEFDIRDIFYKRRTKSDRLRTIVSPGEGVFPICGYYNGLFCLFRYELGLYKLFVSNPILNQFIKLPETVVQREDFIDKIRFASGIGYCQLTNSYKILRMIREFRDGVINDITDIFTIGSDQNWRSVSDVNVPYSINSALCIDNVYTLIMVTLGSAVHWIMQPDAMSQTIEEKGEICLCAFDMTEEKARALPLPLEVARIQPFPGVLLKICLGVLLDKICVCHNKTGDIDLWVMDDYGVEGSWTKQLVLQMGFLHGLGIRSLPCLGLPTVIPGIVSPPGMIMVSSSYKFVLYDMKKKKWSRVIRHNKYDLHTIPFVPGFVSLRNIAPGLMLDAYP